MFIKIIMGVHLPEEVLMLQYGNIVIASSIC